MKPTGVRLHRKDGTVLNCELVCEGVDGEGMEQWRIANAVYQHGDYITVEELPGMTSLGFRAGQSIRGKELDIEWQDEP
jgi:hypothetical protein